MRNGDLSGAINANGTLQQIYDPLTGNADGTGRAPFAGNAIPGGRISPVAQRILSYYPLPNLPGNTRNYVRDADSTVDRNNYDVKLNWNRTTSHQIWGKYSQMDADVGNLFYLGVDGGGNGDTAVKQFTVGQTWTLNSSTVLDCTFGFSRQNQNVLASRTSRSATSAPTRSASRARNGAISYADDPRYAGFPSFNPGFSAIGNNAGWNPLYRDERTYAFSTNVTKLMGQHEVRFGYSGNYLYMDHWQPGDVATPRGDFTFNGAATRLFGAGTQTANLYNQYAQFLLGYFTTATKGIQYRGDDGARVAARLLRARPLEPNQKVTLDLGLRYEYYPLMTRADRGIEQVDLNTLEVLLGGLGGNPRPGHQGQQDAVCAAPGPGLPPQRRHGVPHRLRRHLQPAAVCASAARLLPGQRRRDVPAEQPGRLVRHAVKRHPGPHGAGPEQRPYSAAEQRLDAHAGRRRQPRQHPVVERRRRAPAADGSLRRPGLRRQQGHRRLRRSQHQRVGHARRRQRQPSLLLEGPRDRPARAGARVSRRSTTRCRWPSTGRSRTACC